NELKDACEHGKVSFRSWNCEIGSARLLSGPGLRDRMAAYNGAGWFAVMDGRGQCDDFREFLFQNGKLTSLLRARKSSPFFRRMLKHGLVAKHFRGASRVAAVRRGVSASGRSSAGASTRPASRRAAAVHGE